MASQINFVYFDVGGVVVLDFHGTNKWQELLDDLKIPANLQDPFNDLFDQYELLFNVGKADDHDFNKAIKDKFDISFGNNYSIIEDISNRFAKNTSLWPILDTLSKNYPLGLLTNMYPGMLDILKAEYFPPIKWTVEVDSSLIGFAKPDPAIFKIAQTKANTDPENILFIDNLQKNLDSASSLGFQTLLYNPLELSTSNQTITQYIHPCYNLICF